MGRHSRPTLLSLINSVNFLNCKATQEGLLTAWSMSLGSYPDFLSFFFPQEVFKTGFFWPPSNHSVIVRGCSALSRCFTVMPTVGQRSYR